jgi:hypothetical protein
MRTLLLFVVLSFAVAASCQQTPPESAPETVPETESPGSKVPEPGLPPFAVTDQMTVAQLDLLLRRIDPKLTRQNNSWQLQLRNRPIIVVADPHADRMRMMSPVISADELSEDLLFRLLQANFDSALDARYAVANELLWSVFIHPLSPLNEQQLSSAMFQTFSTAATFGTVFSSGMFIFGGGDSNEELKKLQQEIERLLNPAI